MSDQKTRRHAGRKKLRVVSLPETAKFGRIPDVRANFGIPRSTLYRWKDEGKIRFVKAGRITLVDLDVLRALLSAGQDAADKAEAPA